MKSITDVDKNFKVETKIERDNIAFYNPQNTPFEIYGVFYENGKFRRMPQAVGESVNEGVSVLYTNTAGGRIRFKTNSSYVAIVAKMDGLGKMPHFAFTGSIGFDLYVGDEYCKSFMPPFDITDGYESCIDFADKSMREITINLPLYSNVNQVYIGLEKDCAIQSPTPYKNEKPVVFYGSSITQGGCASRPGTCYQGHLSRRFNIDYINLGFSGSAKGEDVMADYIKNLDMSLFVYDYDHNAPDIEHLRNTHEKMFKTIRQQNPDLPVIMLSRPVYLLKEDEVERRNIVETTYKNAVANGDKNVFFLDGPQLMSLCKNEGTVDNCHPTDFGFASMAQAIGDLIEKHNLV